jgi:hypothetical protein
MPSAPSVQPLDRRAAPAARQIMQEEARAHVQREAYRLASTGDIVGASLHPQASLLLARAARSERQAEAAYYADHANEPERRAAYFAAQDRREQAERALQRQIEATDREAAGASFVACSPPAVADAALAQRYREAADRYWRAYLAYLQRPNEATARRTFAAQADYRAAQEAIDRVRFSAPIDA